jgi:hypothetical protein
MVYQIRYRSIVNVQHTHLSTAGHNTKDFDYGMMESTCLYEIPGSRLKKTHPTRQERGRATPVIQYASRSGLYILYNIRYVCHPVHVHHKPIPDGNITMSNQLLLLLCFRCRAITSVLLYLYSYHHTVLCGRLTLLLH